MLITLKRASAGALALALGALIVPHVAFADATQIIVRCALAQACASTKNTLGAGVQGITAGTTGSSAGVRGLDAATNNGTNIGVLGSTANGGYGVEGTSGNGAYGGVFGSATNGTGAEGDSISSYGVIGFSKTSAGVAGASQSNVGVFGESAVQPGVYGQSTSAEGVLGSSGSGYGVEGITATNDSGHFTATSTGTGVSAASGTGYGLVAVSGGSAGALISSSNGNGADVSGSYIGLIGRSDQFPIVLTNVAHNNLFYVDGSGNVFSHGTYRTFAATRSGHEATAYSTQTTTPNVEDIGSAELVNGVASVRFAPAFAASIDLQNAYHVFLTPGGDTRGLFIASKTASGFIVRETQGGRGRLSFDYRIVARAVGHARETMAFVDPQSDGRPKAPAAAYRAQPATRIPTLRMTRRGASSEAL